MKAELADGTVLEFPDGTDPAVIENTVKHMMQANGAPDDMSVGKQALRAAEFGSRGFIDSAAETIGALPELVASGMRGIGLPAPRQGYYPDNIKKGVMGFGEAISSPINAVYDFGGGTPQSSLESGAYGAGRGMADAASFMLPAAAVAKGAKAGTSLSRVANVMKSQPVAQTVGGMAAGATSEVTGSDIAALLAGITAGAGPGVVKGAIRRSITPFPSQLSANERRLAGAAEDIGINLTAGQKTGSPTLRMMENSFSKLPFTNKSQNAKYAGQRGEFNRAVLKKAGIRASDATPEVIDDAYRAIGREFDDLAKNTDIKIDQKLLDDIAQLGNDHGRRLTKDVSSVFQSYVDDFAQIQKEIAANPKIAGTEYQALSSAIKRRARSAGNNPDLEQSLYAFASKIDDALERSAGPGLRSAWKDVRNRYRNLLTIDKAVSAGTQADRASANVPFSGLRTAVKGMDKTGYARGRGDMNELSRVGDFLGSAIPPDSGTAPRNFMNNMLTFGAPSGAVGMAAAGGNPLLAAATAAATVGGPKAVQTMYNTPGIQSYLANQLAPAVSDRMSRELIAKIIAAQTIGDQTGGQNPQGRLARELGKN